MICWLASGASSTPRQGLPCSSSTVRLSTTLNWRRSAAGSAPRTTSSTEPMHIDNRTSSCGRCPTPRRRRWLASAIRVAAPTARLEVAHVRPLAWVAAGLAVGRLGHVIGEFGPGSWSRRIPLVGRPVHCNTCARNWRPRAIRLPRTGEIESIRRCCRSPAAAHTRKPASSCDWTCRRTARSWPTDRPTPPGAAGGAPGTTAAPSRRRAPWPRCCPLTHTPSLCDSDHQPAR